jgi:hypothetical protein
MRRLEKRIPRRLPLHRESPMGAWSSGALLTGAVRAFPEAPPNRVLNAAAGNTF